MVYKSIYQNGMQYTCLITKYSLLWGVKMYDRIKSLREDKDILQREIARYLHCSQVAYSRYELGQRDIPTSILIALAEYHNTIIDYLLGKTDRKTPYPKKS